MTNAPFYLVSILLLAAFSAWPADAEPAAADPEQHIDVLIARLGSEDFGRREKASAELRTIGFPAFAKLRAAATNPDAEIAKRARDLIGPYDKIMELLDKLPQDWHTTLYYSGLTQTQNELAACGALLVPYLEERLKREPQALYRFNCVTILDRIGAPETLPLLRQLAKDADTWTRVEAVWALGNVKDAASLPLLLEALEKDAEKNVQKEALVAMGKIAGVRLIALGPTRSFELASDKYVTEEARKELERILSYFAEHKTLPEAETLKAEQLPAEFVNEVQPLLNFIRAGQVDGFQDGWRVKTFSMRAGKERWVFVRLDEDPPKKELIIGQ
ncbi:MAG: HEAT repeat domain-containing protein [Planctomycetota bacterium]